MQGITRNGLKRSRVTKYSCVIGGHKTSISVEPEFWAGVKEICDVRDLMISELIAGIDAKKNGNLSSAIRLEVLAFYRKQVAADAK